MTAKKTISTHQPKERTFLVGVELKSDPSLLCMEDSLEELYLLADTSGLEVVGEATQRLDKPDPKTFIRSGKVQELKVLIEETLSEVVIFDIELSPRHQRELEKIFGENIKVLDRTALILDIFAQHAQTKEGSVQVELAQYEYRLPRLTRAWTHLARQAGGSAGTTGAGVGLRGPGETQLEVDRREINRKITYLKKELEKIQKHRQLYRQRRKNARIPIVSLVGYTNAGKSTLLNKISDANVYAADKLFATLDPTTRRVKLPNGETVLFTDTVGFIQKLPTQLIEAFKATLEEITQSDLILLILDSAHINVNAHYQSVISTLKQIGAENIPQMIVLNKSDLFTQTGNEYLDKDLEKKGIPISAVLGSGIEDLLSKVESILFKEMVSVFVKIPYKQGDILSQFHDYGIVDQSKHTTDSVYLKGSLPSRLLLIFRQFEIKEKEFLNVSEV